MNIKNFILALVLFTSLTASAQVKDARIQLADPTIFYHEGTYYLYGTGVQANAGGFVVYVSKDLKKWEGPKGKADGFALKKGDAYGTDRFWAPQVFVHNNKFYMAYTANEHIGLASSDSPLGPFKAENKTTLVPGERRIDPFIFVDDDGKKYMYHVLVADGGNRIYVAEMNDDMSSIKKETLTKCIEATEHWENTENDKWSVTEGPTLIKKDGIYYLIYSANHFKSKDYAVGYATSTSPMGPWKKYEGSPVIHKSIIGEPGAGHGDLFQAKNGKWKYVFHTHFSEKAIAPRLTGIVDAYFDDDKNQKAEKITIKPKSFYYLSSDKK